MVLCHWAGSTLAALGKEGKMFGLSPLFLTGLPQESHCV